MADFHAAFGGSPDVTVRSPGRVNLLGEHTDYNLGYVLPMAIDRGTTLAARVTQSGRVRATSEQLEGVLDVALDALEERDGPAWGAYVRGPIALLRKAGVSMPGLELHLTSDLPIGAGLSSSASVEVGVITAVLALTSTSWSTRDVALLAQRSEHEYAHVLCGVMDQMAVACGRADHALLIDCKTLETRAVPLPSTHRVLVLDTRASRSLAQSAYNERRSTCERAAQKLGVRSLRDATDARLREGRELNDEELRCARHVITENARVLACVDAFARGEMQQAGRLWSASHASLRDDYRVSSAALDDMVDAALSADGVVGARLTGAGFGGCAIALVEADKAEAALASSLRRFAATHAPGDGFIARAAPGAALQSAK